MGHDAKKTCLGGGWGSVESTKDDPIHSTFSILGAFTTS